MVSTLSGVQTPAGVWLTRRWVALQGMRVKDRRGVQSHIMGHFPEQQARPLQWHWQTSLCRLEYALPSRINFAWLPTASTKLELVCCIKKVGKGTRLEDKV